MYDVNYFTTDGSAYQFTISVPVLNESRIAVFLDGVFQRGNANAYSLSGGSITFTGATTSGTNNIVVMHLATEDNRVTNTTADAAVTNKKLNLDYSDSNYRAPTVDANFSATTKTIKAASATVNYGVNDILVFLNGVCLTPTTDYTISGTTLTLQGGAPPAGSNIVVRYLPLTG